jgi:hypothetical protein
MTLQGGLLLVWHGPLRARLAALAVRGQRSGEGHRAE